MADASLAPGLTPERFEELMTLLQGADSVELKLTVPDGDQRSAVQALQMDPLEAEIRQVFFFDTPDLDPQPARRHRACPPDPGRRRQRGEAAARGAERGPPPTCARSRASGWRSTPCPAASSAPVGSRRSCARASVKEAMLGERPCEVAVHKEQRAFFADHAPDGISLDDLAILGPIKVMKLKFPPRVRRQDGRRAVALPGRLAHPRAVDEVRRRPRRSRSAAQTREFLRARVST